MRTYSRWIFLLFWNLAKRSPFIIATFTTRMRKQRNREPPAIFFLKCSKWVLNFSTNGWISHSSNNQQQKCFSNCALWPVPVSFVGKLEKDFWKSAETVKPASQQWCQRCAYAKKRSSFIKYFEFRCNLFCVLFHVLLSLEGKLKQKQKSSFSSSRSAVHDQRLREQISLSVRFFMCSKILNHLFAVKIHNNRTKY